MAEKDGHRQGFSLRTARFAYPSGSQLTFTDGPNQVMAPCSFCLLFRSNGTDARLFVWLFSARRRLYSTSARPCTQNISTSGPDLEPRTTFRNRLGTVRHLGPAKCGCTVRAHCTPVSGQKRRRGEHKGGTTTLSSGMRYANAGEDPKNESGRVH